jgi:RNA recognition motif-containing protein
MTNIYVGNLPFSTGEDELRGLFEAYGTVERAKVVNDRDTGKSRGFGFIEMPDDGDAQDAIESLNGDELHGRKLTVNVAKPREDKGHAGRR